VLARKMPPWPAARGFGDFSNDAGLTTRELEFLISWIDGGVPEGTGDAATFIDHGSHWMMGQPDALLSATPGVTIEPSSGIGFKRFVIETGFTSDRWVRAIDYKPGADGKRVARAAFLTIAGSGQNLGAWTPWNTTTQWPDGAAVRMPARSSIAVDVLYQRSESAVVDSPTVGVYFAEQRTPRPVSDIVLTGPDRARQQLPAETTLLAMRPETIPPGASVEVSVKRPDGSSEVLLWVPKSSHDWAMPYVFKQPPTFPKGSMLRASVHTDTPGAAMPFRITVSSASPAPPRQATTR
jgi:hypothetical protein